MTSVKVDFSKTEFKFTLPHSSNPWGKEFTVVKKWEKGGFCNLLLIELNEDKTDKYVNCTYEEEYEGGRR